MDKSSTVKVVSYSCKAYDKQALCRVFDETISASYVEGVLDKGTVFYAQDALVVTAFVNDQLDADILQQLYTGGTRLITLLCAGFNNINLAEAKRLGLVVVRDGNFSLNGLLGFDMHRQPPKIFMNFVKATAQQV